MLYCFIYLSVIIRLAVADSHSRAVFLGVSDSSFQRLGHRLEAINEDNVVRSLQRREPARGKIPSSRALRGLSPTSKDKSGSSSKPKKSSSSPTSDGNTEQKGSKQSAVTNTVSEAQSSLARLSISTPPGSSLTTTQSDIDRNRSPTREAAREPARRASTRASVRATPFMRNGRVMYRMKDFDTWLGVAKDQIKHAEGMAAVRPSSGGRTAQRAAQKEKKKAAETKVNYDQALKDTDASMAKALSGMATTKIPKPGADHPTNILVGATSEAAMRLADAGMAHEEAERKVANTLGQKGHWADVPQHLSNSFRARAKSKYKLSYAEAVGYKWNARIGAAEAESHPPGSTLREKTNKEVEVAREVYREKAQDNRNYYEEYRRVREATTGSSDLEHETDTFDDILGPGTGTKRHRTARKQF